MSFSGKKRAGKAVLRLPYRSMIQPGKAGLYPDLELDSPTQREAEIAFAQYVQEADAREQAGQLKPGEIVQRDPQSDCSANCCFDVRRSARSKYGFNCFHDFFFPHCGFSFCRLVNFGARV